MAPNRVTNENPGPIGQYEHRLGEWYHQGERVAQSASKQD